jgi:hypothetical protein
MELKRRDCGNRAKSRTIIQITSGDPIENATKPAP